MTTHSSILAWRTPWTEEPDRVTKCWKWLKWLSTHAEVKRRFWKKFSLLCKLSATWATWSSTSNALGTHQWSQSAQPPVQFSRSVMFDSATPWTSAHQASLSITNCRSPPKPMSIELVMPSNHLILCHPFSSCLQSFPASGSSQIRQLFTSGGQSIGASASTSLLPMDTQNWYPLGLVGSPSSPRDSQESSPTPEFKSINSSALSSFSSPTLTSIHDYWKKHSLH